MKNINFQFFDMNEIDDSHSKIWWNSFPRLVYILFKIMRDEVILDKFKYNYECLHVFWNDKLIDYAIQSKLIDKS